MHSQYLRLVHVQRFPRPSRSIQDDDVSGVNGRETPAHLRLDHVNQNALAARNNEAQGLGNTIPTFCKQTLSRKRCEESYGLKPQQKPCNQFCSTSNRTIIKIDKNKNDYQKDYGGDWLNNVKRLELR